MRRKEADKRLRAIQAGVGGNPRHLIVQWVENVEELEKYVGKSLGQIGAEEGNIRWKYARSGGRDEAEGGVPGT